MKNIIKEWFISAPWGKIALVSWGNPNGDPVLLVHGRQDSVATFIPLLEHLPDGYHYVGLDLPGNGRSDSFPCGVKLMRFHFVAAVVVAVKHLAWDQFFYISHSMGCEQGLFYNALYPHRIKKMLLLDWAPSLQRLQIHNLQEYYETFFYDYYNNYEMYNSKREYSRKRAIEAVMRTRGFSEEQAEIVLSRNMVQIGDDLYRLSWDRRLMSVAPQNFPENFYCELFSKNLPPTLLISASENNAKLYVKGKEPARRIINYLKENVNYFKEIDVEGGHDVHFTHPERVAAYVVEFIEKDFSVISKL